MSVPMAARSREVGVPAVNGSGCSTSPRRRFRPRAGSDPSADGRRPGGFTMSGFHGRSCAHVAALSLGVAVLLVASSASALVNYDQGARVIRGVQLLQDANDPTAYYYVPQYPRLATKEDGSYELLCLKYVDAQGGTNGGLLHALIEFTLPQDKLDQVQTDLKKVAGSARILGPVQLMQSTKDGVEGTGSFEVVSAVLPNKGDGGCTRSMLASRRAPLTPGPKAVVAA